MSADEPTTQHPADDHVHSQWSWDTDTGDMAATCARAVELGLPSVAFTEHVDHWRWRLGDDARLPGHWWPMVDDGVMAPRPFDVAGYLAEVERCRERFPSLRILTGIESGEPHRHPEAVRSVLRGGAFERVLASVHAEPYGPPGEWRDVGFGLGEGDPYAVLRRYLAELRTLITTWDDFEVLAHIDYPLRYWPQAAAGPFDPAVVEDDVRETLRTLARADRVLELNTRRPLEPVVLRWWREEGGRAISFASDAHEPAALARGFREAAQVAAAAGFRGGAAPHDFWVRA